MYSILLADDEKMVLETLTDHVPWDTMGIKVAGAAKNGREALELTRQLNPDIILTDVRMPIMDGLEFAKWAKQLSKRVKIVFLSGHDEFQYIKAALSVDASGYLLKPLDLVELAQLMEKVKQKCEEAKLAERSQEIVREKLLRQLLIEESAERRAEQTARLKVLAVAELPALGPYRAAFLIVSRSRRDCGTDAGLPAPIERSIADAVRSRLRALGYSGMLIDWESGTFAALYPSFEACQFSEVWLRLQKLIEDDFPVSLTIGISRMGDGLADAHDLFREAKAAVGHAFYFGHGSLLPAEELPLPISEEIAIEEHCAALCRTIGHLHTEETEAESAAFIRMLRDRYVHPNLARSAAIRLITAVEHHFRSAFKEMQTGTFGSEREIMNRCGTLDEIGGHIRHVCLSLIIALSEKDKDRHLHIARHIQEIIDRSYQKLLTVEDIAKEIFFSPNYIRTIFKDKTGRTILEAITGKRMERASGLLADKSLKIHEIAVLVGYENTSYFCSIFHKYTGQTPNQYRKQYY